MRDFIFIIGTSGIGKSTLAQGLLRHYRTTVVEQHMVPEFVTRDGTEPMTGELEERTCWENQKAMMLCFNRLGYRNVIASDIDDLRTRDIPSDFRGFDFVTLKLICTDLLQLQSQMRNRGEGLIDFELQEKLNAKVSAREILPNEHLLDITRLSAVEVLERAIEIIENTLSLRDYEYVPPKKSEFYSWVPSNGLR